MNLHEYQAKGLLTEHGIPAPKGLPAASVPEARAVADGLGGDTWVVKAQVHAGGRGKAGGGRKVTGRQAPPPPARDFSPPSPPDRALGRVVFTPSSAGGMDIEEIAAKSPEKILKAVVDPIVGLQAYQCREIGFAMGLNDKQIGELARLMLNVFQLYTGRDLALLEINPLVVTQSGELLALDAKIQVDDNALYRHKDLEALRDETQDDIKERKARAHDLNYVSLDGNIGCMVNGAGLAMATMDLIKLHGGMPANFLDVGGGTTAERVAEAFKIILSDEKVKAILVNIFGGIVRCDLIAEGIIKAVEEVHVAVPVVVRLEGTNVEKGREMLKASGLKILSAESLTEAAKLAVAAVG